jgi:rubrerythrin
MEETEKKEFVCLRCGYKWVSRKTKEPPRACPYCKSFKWNVPKKEQ